MLCQVYLNFYFSYSKNKRFEPLREFVKAAHRAEKLALSNDFEEIKSFIEKIGTNRQLLDRKLLFDFKKPFSLIPKYISTTPRRNAVLKNSISPNKSISIDQFCRLSTTFQDAQSSASTEIAKKPSFSDCEDFSSDFSSKKRFNRHFLSIENDRDCRLSRLREKSFVNSENSGIELDLMKSPKWSG